MLLHDHLLQAAVRTPDAIAIDIPPGTNRARHTLTFAQLKARAEVLATRLHDIRVEDRVVVLLPRHHPDVFPAQLAILMSGGAFVCPDPRFPDPQIGHIARDSGAVAAITDARNRERLEGVLSGQHVHHVEDCTTRLPTDTRSTAKVVTPDNLAYVIYTSGTTGKPKGVLLEHRGVANLVTADVDRFGFHSGDRCVQSSSLSFDSSIEEAWPPLAGGATLVVADDETVRLGPDLLPWLRAERATVLMPTPTLLRTLGVRDPRAELPDLRLVYVGGEAVPDEVLDTWADPVWLENGYGPTECTVVCTRGRLHRGQAVHIGVPVPGHDAFLLEVNGTRRVPQGEVGELCMRGPGIARGYLGLPDLTARQFPSIPGIGRVYRTGDLARFNENGELLCLGRADSQVKIRGYRIELEAIEAALAQAPGIASAACRVQGGRGREQIVGFVVERAGKRPVSHEALLQDLGRELPDYMVPSAVQSMERLPMTVNGKLDRDALPEIEVTSAPRITDGRRPSGPLETLVAQAFERALGVPKLGADIDFFDAGGTSVRAAEVISILRGNEITAALAVRDLYEAPTIAGLALQAAHTPVAEEDERTTLPPLDPSPERPTLVTTLQLLWILSGACLGGVTVWIGLAILPVLLAWTQAATGLFLGPTSDATLLDVRTVPVFILAAPLAFIVGRWLFLALSILVLVVAKKTLIGTYREGRVRAWSLAYFRHWTVEQFAQLVPWGMLAGTVFYGGVLRLLGARIGSRVHFHRGIDLTAGGWDLLRIDSGASIGQDCRLGVVERIAGELVVRPVHVGRDATLEVRSGMDGGTSLGAQAALAPLASLRSGTDIADGQRADGVPAAAVGPQPAPTPTATGIQPAMHGLGLWLCQSIAGTFLAMPGFAVAAFLWIGLDWTSEQFVDWVRQPFSSLLLPGILIALAVIGSAAWVFGLALFLRFTPRVRQGNHSRWGFAFILIWIRTGFLEQAGRWLAGTMFWPVWLRLAGMRVGPHTEISTIIDVLPEDLSIGGTCFFADGIYLGGPRIQGGTVTTAGTTLGDRVFLGNHAVLPAGTRLADDTLLGVCTVADSSMPKSTSWFGHPPFPLPRREVVTMDARETFEPGPWQYVRRFFWEAARFVLPAILVMAALATLHGVGSIPTGTGTGTVVALALGTVIAVGAGLAALVLTLKWVLLGRVRPGQHALWSGWCCRWDFVYMAWGFLAHGVLARFGGTLLLAWYLRAMGVTIGRRVLLGSSFAQVVDPDMIHLGDGATCDSMFQAHSFEDRVLKIDRVYLQAGSTTREASVLLYGADVGSDTEIATHSVVMKHEQLLPKRAYDGVPTRAVPARTTAR